MGAGIKPAGCGGAAGPFRRAGGDRDRAFGRARLGDALLDIGSVEQLVSGAIGLSGQAGEQRTASRRRWGTRLIGCVAVAAFCTAGQLALGIALPQGYLTALGVLALAGGWACFGAKEILPAYYDENRVCTYSDGIFRMNLVGLRFHNSNWPHILRACRVWMLSALAALPALGLLCGAGAPAIWLEFGREACLIAIVGFVLPVLIAAKRYQ